MQFKSVAKCASQGIPAATQPGAQLLGRRWVCESSRLSWGTGVWQLAQQESPAQSENRFIKLSVFLMLYIAVTAVAICDMIAVFVLTRVSWWQHFVTAIIEMVEIFNLWRLHVAAQSSKQVIQSRGKSTCGSWKYDLRLQRDIHTWKQHEPCLWAFFITWTGRGCASVLKTHWSNGNLGLALGSSSRYRYFRASPVQKDSILSLTGGGTCRSHNASL